MADINHQKPAGLIQKTADTVFKATLLWSLSKALVLALAGQPFHPSQT